MPGPIGRNEERFSSVDLDVSNLKGGQKFLEFSNFETYSKNDNDIDPNQANNVSKYFPKLKIDLFFYSRYISFFSYIV